MTGEDGIRGPDAASGWLIVRRDGIVLMADRRACALIGAPGPEALTGREWASLVVPLGTSDSSRLGEACAALVRGDLWHGHFLYRYAHDESTLDTSISTVPNSSELSIIALREVDTPPRPAPSHPREGMSGGAEDAEEGPVDGAPASTPASTPGRPADMTFLDVAEEPLEGESVLRAQLATHDALRDLSDPGAAARASLQSLQSAVPFDWAAVLQIERNECIALAVYPSPMAGVSAGSRWRAGTAEAHVGASGEPSLAGALESEHRTLLDRLPAFGLRSRILIPLYAGADVAGVLALYRSGPRAFDATDGVIAERTVRRLGEAISTPWTTGRTQASGTGPPTAPALQVANDTAAIDTVGLDAAEHPSASRLESLGELVAGMAHELNNPLTTILGYSQILGSLDQDERTHALRAIEDEAQRAARIVRDLLAFARQRPAERRVTDVEAMLQRIIDLRRYSLEVDNVRVITRFGRVPEILADEGQLEQAFLALLSNAHQALLSDGGEVTVTTRTTPSAVQVSFADNGPGVPEEIRTRIFEPFFTRRDVGAGQGLGLSIVFGVVANHGGRIWVEASAAGGANFVIEIPLTPETLDAAPSEADEKTPLAPEDHRILVVDGEAPVRALMRQILEGHGFQVQTAESGREAHSMLERGWYSMVIMDLRMPGMGGTELFHEIVERWPQMTAKVLFVTGDIK